MTPDVIERIQSMIDTYLGYPDAGGTRKLPDMDGINELRQYIAEYISGCIENNKDDEIAKVLILQGLFYKNIIAEAVTAPAEGDAAAAAKKEYLKEMVRICEAISTKANEIEKPLKNAVGITEATIGGKRRGSKRRRVTFKKRKH